MAITITIPRLGWNMDEGVFVGWLKRDGETVQVGDPLFSLEGEKATQDIESFDQGVLHIPATAPQAGDRVAVGAVLGYLLAPGEQAPAASENAKAMAPHAAEDDLIAHHQFEYETTHSHVDRNRLKISPLARRMARELGIDSSILRGSGRTGRIRKVDVLAAAQTRGLRSENGEKVPPSGRALPVSAIRRTIASRMLASHHTTAPVTLTTTVDATNLVNLRQQFKTSAPAGCEVPGFNDFLIKLTALALKDHPLLNARWSENRIEIPEETHMGIAVDTEAGLFVPVIRNVATLGLGEIAARAKELAQRAREQRLSAGEMQGGTFTISNLGAFGIETFTPIINLPESAILGLGRIERQPTMLGDQVVPRDRMSLSLTFDHRVVDGAPAARFLQHLGRLVENPAPWLIS